MSCAMEVLNALSLMLASRPLPDPKNDIGLSGLLVTLLVVVVSEYEATGPRGKPRLRRRSISSVILNGAETSESMISKSRPLRLVERSTIASQERIEPRSKKYLDPAEGGGRRPEEESTIVKSGSWTERPETRRDGVSRMGGGGFEANTFPGDFSGERTV